MTSLSVAMATYHGARFIREQLASIAAQTVLPAELVVTDDASTDDTVAIVRQFAATAPFPVHVYCNEARLGYRANFMRNIAMCSSDVIAFCDQDDIWAVTKLERALLPFRDPEVLLCCHEAWLIDSDGKRLQLAQVYPLPERSPALSLWPLRSPLGFSMLFRRELLQFGDLWDRSIDSLESQHRMAHDQWIFSLAAVFGAVVYLDEPLVEYRQHENSTYGVGPRGGTSWDRLSRWVEAARVGYGSFSVAAARTGLLLDEAQARLDGAWRARAREAAVSYRDLERHCALRSSAYTAHRAAGRLGAWLELVREGAYAGSRWAFGRKTAVKDLSWLLLPTFLVDRLPLSRSTDAHGARADVALTSARS